MVRALLNVGLKRIIGAIPTVLALSIMIFVALRAVPADPLALLLPPNATEADAASTKKALGLDRPIVVQYGIWLKDALQGNLGSSISFQEPVTRLIGKTLPATLELSLSGLTLALLISIPGGLLLFVSRDTPIEILLDGLVVCILSVPAFLWGLFLMLTLGVTLGLLPFAGRVDFGARIADGSGFLLFDNLIRMQWRDLLDVAEHLCLPSLALALGFCPLVIRVLRSSLVDTSEEPYVMVARQRGISESKILISHMLKNAALPTITLIGAQLGFLFGGTLLVETIFSFPGVGNLMVQAVRNHDLPLIQGIALVFCIAVLAINTLVDILYVVLNPKLRDAT
jgi:ABC-type dipeptide/oligopeptide/nickel transport system permease component